jgi:hypothetical protein
MIAFTFWLSAKPFSDAHPRAEKIQVVSNVFSKHRRIRVSFENRFGAKVGETHILVLRDALSNA